MKNELKCKSKWGRHLKISKKISVFFLVCVLAIGICPYSALAANSNNSIYLENSLLNDLNFIAKADITKKVIDGTYVYEFENKDKTTTMNRSNEQNFTCSVAQIIAPSEEEAVMVEQNIQRARQQSLMRSGGGSRSNYNWFLGSSLYLELRIDYTTEVVGQATYYRMNNITATRTVNSGTIISSAALNFGVQGTGENQIAVYEQENYDITYSGNPYSTTTPSSWAYATQGDMMGAGLEVYARRPGGSNTLYSVTVSIFS